MTATTMPAGHFHAVRFYKDEHSLCEMIGGFMTAALRAGEPALIIATPEHTHGIMAALRHGEVDVDERQATGELVVVDAATALSGFMVDGMPHATRFSETLAPTLDAMARGRRDLTIRAYGEMVDVLWKAGQTVAATRLETLWNDLARSHAFSLLCGYAMGNFYKDAAVDAICSHHSHVVSDAGVSTPVN